MEYLTIAPPIDKPFAEMTRKEAKAYFAWFLSIIPERLSILEQEVCSSNNEKYQNWVGDKTSDSLYILGDWFAQSIVTMPRPDGEERIRQEQLKELPAKYRELYQSPKWVLTEKTFSLITDIGIYLGETFRQNLTGIQWELYAETKSNAYYQWPVLTGSGKINICNPLALVHVIALGLLDKTNKPERLHELYNIWSVYVK